MFFITKHANFYILTFHRTIVVFPNAKKRQRTNHVKRLHGTIRGREKVMRAIKTDKTPIVEGQRLFYNFIKPHEGLNGMTPSEKAGIIIDGENKWLTLMKTSLSYKRYKESC